MSKILVWIKEPFKKAKHVWISPRLENLQKTVGGYIEAVQVSNDAVILCNEEALLTDTKYNVTVGGIQLFGPIILVGQQGEEFASCKLTADDMRILFPDWMKEGKNESE